MQLFGQDMLSYTSINSPLILQQIEPIEAVCQIKEIRQRLSDLVLIVSSLFCRLIIIIL